MTFPGTASARRPMPPQLRPFDASLIGGANSVDHAYRVQAAVHNDYSDFRARHDPALDPQLHKDSLALYTVSDGALALEPALAAVAADRDAAQADVDKIANGQRVDPTDIAAQLVAQAYWARKRAVLDSLSPAKVPDAARSLVSTADDAEIPILATELPDYLLARNVPSDWLSGVLASRVAGAGEAQSRATLLAKQHAVLAQNHASLTKSIRAGLPAPSQLLDPANVTAEPYSETFSPYAK